MNRSVIRRLVWALGALYLTVATLGAWTTYPYTHAGRFNEIVYALMDVTATNNDFGFFAPSVASQVQVHLLFHDAQGHTESYDLWSNSREINFRLNSVITTAMRRPALRDICARSWAASLLGNRPAAQRITLIAYAHLMPTMAQYRAGVRPAWQPFYEGTFERVTPNG